MKAFKWPGNVRELRNAIERAIIVSEDDVLSPEDLMLGQTLYKANDKRAPNKSLAELEKIEIEKVLKDCKGNRSQASARLGINRKTLREKIRKYCITFDESPSGEKTPPILHKPSAS